MYILCTYMFFSRSSYISLHYTFILITIHYPRSFYNNNDKSNNYNIIVAQMQRKKRQKCVTAELQVHRDACRLRSLVAVVVIGGGCGGGGGGDGSERFRPLLLTFRRIDHDLIVDHIHLPHFG